MVTHSGYQTLKADDNFRHDVGLPRPAFFPKGHAELVEEPAQRRFGVLAQAAFGVPETPKKSMRLGWKVSA